MSVKISIVTPSYNQAGFLEQTMDSVLSQQYPDLEYIVVDGGSTDHSVEIIKKYEKYLKYWVSEKDKGQVDAINKGLQYCTGTIFNWLNSDDFLEAGALQKIADAFTPDTDLVAGKVNNFTASSSEVEANKDLSASGLMCWKPEVQFIQPGVWMRRAHFLNCGGIREQFHYAFDWDLLIRYLYHFPRVVYLDDLLVHFRIHGDSKTGSSLEKFAAEERTIISMLEHDPAYPALHEEARYKSARSRWVQFLEETASSSITSKKTKIVNILRNISAQPMDLAVSRITFGTIRQILTGGPVS